MTTVRLFNNHIRISFALLALAEGLIFYVSFCLAVAIRFNSLDFNSAEILASVGSVLTKAIIYACLHLLGMTALGLYQIEQFRGKTAFAQFIVRVLTSQLLASILLMVVFYFFPRASKICCRDVLISQPVFVF